MAGLFFANFIAPLAPYVILTGKIANLTPNQLANLIRAYPGRTDLIVQCIQAPNPNRPFEEPLECLTEPSLVQFHATTHWQIQGLPPPPGWTLDPPGWGRWNIVQRNTRDFIWPMHLLIWRDMDQEARALVDTGRWNPLSFDALGKSYLYIACLMNSDRVLRIIINEGITANNPNYWLNPAWLPSFRLAPTPESKLDVLLAHGKWNFFWDAWTTITPQNMTLVLNHNSHQQLCKYATGAQADNFRTMCFLNLATLDLGNLPGTVWHIAVRHNPNVDFLDFLHRQTPNTINTKNGTLTPIFLAYRNRNLPIFQRLILLGADPNQVLSSLLFEVVPLENNYLRAIFPLPSAPRRSAAQVYPTLTGRLFFTLLHGVKHQERQIAASALTPAQKNSRRTTLFSRARRHIALLRRGNPKGVPSLLTRGIGNRTPLDQVRQWYTLPGYRGYHHLFEVLEPNVAEVAAQAAAAGGPAGGLALALPVGPAAAVAPVAAPAGGAAPLAGGAVPPAGPAGGAVAPGGVAAPPPGGAAPPAPPPGPGQIPHPAGGGRPKRHRYPTRSQ
ncbi:hypothetical protein BDV12DRAFT_201631 [Aspergillus spectabilis]